VKRVLTAVILIPIVVLALFRAPLWLFTLLVLGVALLAAKEYLDVMKAQGFRPMWITSYILLTLVFGVSYSVTWLFTSSPAGPILGFPLFPVFAICSPLIFLLLSLARNPISQALPDAAISCLLLPYVGFTLGLLPLLREFPTGPLYVLYLMLLVWCGDIAAYYVGRAVGRHKLAPRISPGKTWRGQSRQSSQRRLLDFCYSITSIPSRLCSVARIYLSSPLRSLFLDSGLCAARISACAVVVCSGFRGVR